VASTRLRADQVIQERRARSTPKADRRIYVQP